MTFGLKSFSSPWLPQVRLLLPTLLTEFDRTSVLPLVVALVSNMTSHSLAISNQMLTVLGIVLGLVVSFRTTSAYDRHVAVQF